MIFLVALVSVICLAVAVIVALFFRQFIRFIPLILFVALVAGFLGGLFLWKADEVPSALIDKQVPNFALEPVGGGELLSQTLFQDGQVRLLNVWASWCAPCRAEHEMLMELKNRGVKIVGLNYKDSDKNAQNFLQELGNPFADNLSDKNGRVGIDLGVYGVPESFVVAGDGTIIYKHIGPILPMHLEQLMLELARAQTVR